MKSISVIVPAKIRNTQEADWLRVALESIPSKSPVVVVNDHSLIPWKDVEKVVDFGRAHVEHLPDDKHGLAACRNWAMKFVLTEFFFPLDADDYLAPDALKIAMAAYPGDGYLYGSTILFDDKQRTTYRAKPYDICQLLKSVYWPNGCLQRTENWRKVGGWDESLPLYEDWDYWLCSAKAGIIGHHIPDVLYCYRQNPNGIIQTLKRNPAMAARARALIEAKHEDLFSGVDPMCSTGCGNKKTKADAHTPPAALRAITIPLANGMILLTYAGAGSSMARSFYGKSGTHYRFGGPRRKFGYVAEEDAPGLLQMKENGSYVFTVEKAATPEGKK